MNNKVSILSIGDEILIGQIDNTNAGWMAKQLNDWGFNTVNIQTLSDEPNSIIRGLKQSMEISDLVLVTGGLGPTKDDITKTTIADFFDSKLIINDDILEHVTQFFAQRKRKLTELNRLQAMVPDNCEVIINKEGTAPGMYFHRENTHFVFMPGVPFEMKYIMNNWVLPQMKKKLNPPNTIQKTVLTHGMGESFLVERIQDWEDQLPEDLSLAYLPSPGRVRLRLRGQSSNREALLTLLDEQLIKLHDLIPELIYGYDDDKMEEIIGQLLMSEGKTIALAESCTGGYIGHKLTEVPGSSSYFLGSAVTYSNEAKSKLLGIEKTLIMDHGAVSEEVVKAMAQGARSLYGSDYALATTGIAGPGGGTKGKPVGTVWIALADNQQVIAKRFQFGDHRIRNINMTTFAALNLLRKHMVALQKDNIPI
jgi:nicotinamide-nucleotide amidase